MVYRPILRISLSALAFGGLVVLSSGGLAHAQQPAGPPAAPEASSPQAEAQQLQMKIQQIDQQLGQARQKVMQSEELGAEQEKLAKAVMDAMTKADPEAETKLSRLDAIRQKFEASGGQPEDAQALMQEGQQLSQSLQQVQQKVMSEDPLSGKIDAFEKKVEQKMIAADASAKKLLEERKSLIAKLEKLISASIGG